MKSVRISRSRLVTAALLAAGYVSVAQGTTYTWTPGPTNVNWGTAANWAGGVLPPLAPTDPDVTDVLFAGNFSTASGGGVQATQNYGSITLNSISFGSFATTNGTFAISGGSGTTGGLLPVINLGAGGIQSTANGTVAFTAGANRKITLTADQPWSHSTTTNIISVRRDIEGAFKITKQGASTIEFAGNNANWTGGLSFDEGIIRGATFNNAFGVGTITAINNKLSGFTASGTAETKQVIAGEVILGGTGTFTLGGSWKITLQNKVTLQNDKIIDVGGLNVAATELNREISGQIVSVGSAALIKSGGGTLLLSNATNSYSGNTKIIQGILEAPNAGYLGTGTQIILGANLPDAGTTTYSTGTLRLTDANLTLTRPIIVDNGNGRLDFNTSINVDSPITAIGVGGFTKVGAGTLTAKSIRIAGGLNTATGSFVLKPDGSDAVSSRTGGITLGGVLGAWTSQLDITNNKLVVDYATTSPLANVADMVKSGYAAGSWNGNGIASATAAASSASDKTAVGYGEASVLGIGTFAGQAVDATAVVIRHTYVGDANLDGKVNTLDFNHLAGGFGLATGAVWTDGDLNYDGTVDSLDFSAMTGNYGKSLPASAPSLGAVVPEPSAVLLLPALLGLARRRKN